MTEFNDKNVVCTCCLKGGNRMLLETDMYPWWMSEWPFWFVVMGVAVLYWHVTRHWMKTKKKKEKK